MQPKSKKRRPFQYTLRQLLVVFVVVALLCPFLPTLFHWLTVHRSGYCVAVLLLPVVAVCLGYVLGATLVRWALPNRSVLVSGALILLLLLLTAASLCVLVARYRWLHSMIDDPAFPRPWPYPDHLLVNYHNWLDARYPVQPGYFKIHGEYYRVLRTVDAVAVAAVSLSAIFVGLAFPNLAGKVIQSGPFRYLCRSIRKHLPLRRG